MTSRRMTTILFFVAVTFLLPAHEFWMQPDKFRYKAGEVMKLNLQVGEEFIGERWDLGRHRVVRFDHHTAGAVQGLVEHLNTSGQGNHLELPLVTEGTHLFIMQSNNAFIELPADEFNAYLKDDGLDDILTLRSQGQVGNLSAPGREYYQRNAKLLVQVGEKTDAMHQKITGLPLEIVPLQNPYAVKLTGEIKFKVFFEGQPLPYTLVKVWNRKDGRTLTQKIYTQKDGTFSTRLSNTGMWMVSCVKMVPAREAGADWQSYWSSLVFGL